jgi:hypothetical protein
MSLNSRDFGAAPLSGQGFIYRQREPPQPILCVIVATYGFVAVSQKWNDGWSGVQMSGKQMQASGCSNLEPNFGSGAV